MTYADPADFRERTRKPWAAGLVLAEADCTDADLTALIAQVAGRIELDLDDDFDPPSPDLDETIYVDGTALTRLLVPRRVRSLTTLRTRNTAGTLTDVTSTNYRLHPSLNATGTAMIDGRKFDWIDAWSGTVWPVEAGSVQLTGKFGWAAVPDDIKRLLALSVYDIVKGTSDPLTRIVQRQTLDATITYGPSREGGAIMDRYRRRQVVIV